MDVVLHSATNFLPNVSAITFTLLLISISSIAMRNCLEIFLPSVIRIVHLLQSKARNLQSQKSLISTLQRGRSAMSWIAVRCLRR